MNFIRKTVGILFALLGTVAMTDSRPNFLVIVADDLGFSDLGAFGGEINTPVLDSLTRKGVQFTNFHAAPTCSPTRAMLLTGLDNHEAGLGAMAEARAANHDSKPGYEGSLRADNATVAELLRANGYRTHFSGKWHLGMQTEQAPHRRGFETSFVLLQGMHNHFGYDLSGAAVGRRPTYLANSQPVEQLPDDFYSSDYFAAQLVEQLRVAQESPEGNRPFFAYLAFTAPHWPLHAPQEVVERYQGWYEAGYDVLRTQRLQRQVELGLLEEEVVPGKFDLAPPWDRLTPQEQARSSRRMEVYAAMVERMDENVGRILDALRESGQLDNTYIFFLSDNGAEAADVTALPPEAVVFLGIEGADNSLDNIGAPTSFDSVGPGWAEATTAPFWRVKGYQAEGGTRVASFLAGPGINARIAQEFVSVMDIVPTVLDLAGVSRPGEVFEGRRVRPIRGHSWMRWLKGNVDSVHDTDRVVGAELFGGRVLRQGEWKLLDIGDGRWRLFNIFRDPGETNDLADIERGRRDAMATAWEAYARDVKVVLPQQPMPIINRPSERQ